MIMFYDAASCMNGIFVQVWIGNDCSLVNTSILLITACVCASNSRDLLGSRQGCSNVPQVIDALRAAYHEGKTHFAY